MEAVGSAKVDLRGDSMKLVHGTITSASRESACDTPKFVTSPWTVRTVRTRDRVKNSQSTWWEQETRSEVNFLGSLPGCDLSCKENECPHQCVPTPGGSKCLCHPGFEQDERNKRGCVDINECAAGRPCDHICVNTRGSFKCLCHEEYALRSGKRSFELA